MTSPASRAVGGWIPSPVYGGGQGWGRRRVRLEPIGPLPSRFLAEGRAERRQARIGGRYTKRPSGLAFLVRIVDIVISRANLDGADERVVPLPIGVTEPAQVYLP